MIVITGLTCLKTESDIANYRQFDHSGNVISGEVIRRIHFKRGTTGEDIVIGFSGEAADILGICFKAFEDQRAKILKLQYENNNIVCKVAQYEEKLQTIKNMSFWSRLKFVFAGLKKCVKK
jgi:hypothetical protein